MMYDAFANDSMLRVICMFVYESLVSYDTAVRRWMMSLSIVCFMTHCGVLRRGLEHKETVFKELAFSESYLFLSFLRQPEKQNSISIYRVEQRTSSPSP